MFLQESEMTATVARWMRSNGLTVKAEFVTPWGICDLVGASPRKRSVEDRLRMKQRKPIGSISRSLILLGIPDAETRRSVGVESLREQYQSVLSLERLNVELAALEKDKFIVRTSTGSYQKLNGWMPIHKRLVAVELKLTRVEEALQQAINNLGFTDESYVAFPSQLARQLVADERRKPAFTQHGCGIIGVTKRDCNVLLKATANKKFIDRAIQTYSVEKFWTAFVRSR